MYFLRRAKKEVDPLSVSWLRHQASTKHYPPLVREGQAPMRIHIVVHRRERSTRGARRKRGASATILFTSCTCPLTSISCFLGTFLAGLLAWLWCGSVQSVFGPWGRCLHAKVKGFHGSNAPMCARKPARKKKETPLTKGGENHTANKSLQRIRPDRIGKVEPLNEKVRERPFWGMLPSSSYVDGPSGPTLNLRGGSCCLPGA